MVELLLRRPEAGAWLRAKNRAGPLPLDCVEKSKKSASAKAFLISSGILLWT